MTAILPTITIGGPDPLPVPVAAHAAGRFAEAGVIVLKDLLPPDRVAAVNNAYDEIYGSNIPPHRIKEVGDGRAMITLAIEDEFASPDIFANPVALSIVAELLGVDFILGSYVAVTSQPGAAAQGDHADQAGLFEDIDLDASVPPYSVTLVIPLVALNGMTGSTRFYPGTHRDPEAGDLTMIAPDAEPGDAILFDSRILHGGQANRSDAPRPILYCTYHRAWYRDVSNFRDMPAVIVDDVVFDGMTDAQRRLISWSRREFYDRSVSASGR
ncbi:MAG: phytanoyl-CoA dioxygenase family protein [Alphaproteobacteria bacterium]